jgi:tRNA U38,U39,U40 pseudouridine synthase TruA
MEIKGLIKRQDQFEEMIRQVMATLVELTNAQQRASSILETLAQRQVNTEATLNTLALSQANTEEALKRLADKQATTQENLNILLLTVERHIAGHK